MADESPTRLSNNTHRSFDHGSLIERLHDDEQPRRRHSDGVDPFTRSSLPVQPTQTLAGGGGQRDVPSGARPRPQSDSGVRLETRLGQELRRISDEFHMSYQQMADVRRHSQVEVPHASSFPERRGSFMERLGELVGYLPSHRREDGRDDRGMDELDGPFIPRRRARSEIVMASGLATASFGRMDSVITDSERSGEESEESDNLSQAGEGDTRATFTLSLEEQ